jgi:hypothetical protein
LTFVNSGRGNEMSGSRCRRASKDLLEIAFRVSSRSQPGGWLMHRWVLLLLLAWSAAQARRAQDEIDRRNAALHSPVQAYVYSPPRPESARDRQRARCNAARAAVDRAVHDGWDSSVRMGLERAAIDACFGL